MPWNPEDAGPDATGSPSPPPRRPGRRGSRKWIVFAAAFVLLGALAWRVIVVLPEFLPDRSAAEAPAAEFSDPDASSTESPPTGERSATRAARDHAEALRDVVRREGAGFPGEGALLEIERNFVRAERAAERRDYAAAEAEYRRAVRGLENLRGKISAWRAAKEAIGQLEEDLRDVRVLEAFEADGLTAVRGGLASAGAALEIGRHGEAAQLASAAQARLAEARQAAMDRMEAEVARGQRALAKGDKATAIEAFERVLELDPTREAALVGRQRADTIAEVSARMERGRRLEAAGDLHGALAEYAEAAGLDAFAVDARQGASRVRRALRDEAVEAGIRAVNRMVGANRWEEAEQRLRELRAEYPEDDRLKRRREVFAEERRLNRVRVALIAAREAESAREWERARGIYRDLIDTGVDRPEVVQGYERTGRILRALQAFTVNLRLAREASERGDYQDAITRFNAAMERKPDYVDLTAEDAELERFLRMQSVPVPVTFLSDGRTLVSYMGPMNRSPAVMGSEETVELLPGRYRIRGSRMRYVPVELEILVRGDRPPPTVRVVARERER